MNERAKITASHLARHAVVYLRQSSAAQVEHNRESTERQYGLASKARELGWPAERIVVIDEDLGLSGAEPRPAPALPGSLPRWRSPVSASCSVWKSRAWPAKMPNGIASSISPASPTR
jgi:hypothetical protein